MLASVSYITLMQVVYVIDKFINKDGNLTQGDRKGKKNKRCKEDDALVWYY